jgi:TetR/AcrR family transcriptional regulator
VGHEELYRHHRFAAYSRQLLTKTSAKKTKRRGPGRPSKEVRGDLALLRAGQSAFARDGFEATSLRKIAATAGVDPALVAHHFGSKEAFWKAVVDRLVEELMPLLAELEELQKQVEVPIRVRFEKAIRHMVASVCEEPDLGMFFSRMNAERGGKLDLLIEKMIRPYHDAFLPLLEEAMRANVIRTQPVELLYFMLWNTVLMTVSYRHVFELFDPQFGKLDQLQAAMANGILNTFFVDVPKSARPKK